MSPAVVHGTGIGRSLGFGLRLGFGFGLFRCKNDDGGRKLAKRFRGEGDDSSFGNARAGAIGAVVSWLVILL